MNRWFLTLLTSVRSWPARSARTKMRNSPRSLRPLFIKWHVHHVYPYSSQRVFPLPTIRTTELIGLNALFQGRTNYIRLQEDSWVWSTLPTTRFALDFNKFPTSRARSLILLADLRGGAHGRVWLACSSSGAGCVIKFARDDSRKLRKMLKQEKKVWRNVWRRPARIQRLGGAKALVMPYVQPCPKDDRRDPKVMEAVKTAVAELARCGIQHNDLKWEHVGLFRKVNEEVGAVLFDLSNSETIQEEKALLKMLTDLQLSNKTA